MAVLRSRGNRPNDIRIPDTLCFRQDRAPHWRCRNIELRTIRSPSLVGPRMADRLGNDDNTKPQQDAAASQRDTDGDGGMHAWATAAGIWVPMDFNSAGDFTWIYIDQHRQNALKALCSKEFTGSTSKPMVRISSTVSTEASTVNTGILLKCQPIVRISSTVNTVILLKCQPIVRSLRLNINRWDGCGVGLLNQG